jgi:type I restriction-modification system DNA methylase subunit
VSQASLWQDGREHTELLPAAGIACSGPPALLDFATMTAHGFDLAFQAVQKLATDFQANYDFYLSSAYVEAQARKDYIDKFFIALGWDVNNEHHPNPFEQEVKVERGVSMGLAQRHADYAFHVAPRFQDPRFIVEAKKPFGELVTAENYFQTIRYGWNLQTPLAGLTDFEHFHLLDCRYKPDIDTAIDRCQEKWSLQDYFDREKFGRLYWLISREAIANGSLEKFAEALPRPRGKGAQRRLVRGAFQRIDESFLEKLDEYRVTLARVFKNRNPDLDSDTLTEATQRTLDRLVFMRFLEDKVIEPSHFVAKFGARGTAWQGFVAASRRLDAVYNGIVFKKHGILDAPDFRVDDDAFDDICKDLSHQNSPYDFNAIPIHILGSIYERFLGNIIVATDKRVRVEQKPEVRKAGGVYYTPDYIVRYIVENTVGKLIEEKTPDQISEMRFADIACGSGSFLLGVYDVLLRYHAKFYNDHPRKARKSDCVAKDGVLHLSLEKKCEILLNNIYGVDIDPQAVEVTQLSLYLKLLEEETIASARGYQLKMHAAILPPLNRNIVCGNSLIGRDVLNGELFCEENERKLNPMNFEDAFPEIMNANGFDAVLGNPPYGIVFDLKVKEYLERHYPTFVRNNDIYVAFCERAVALLHSRGLFGYIIPNTFLLGPYFDDLKRNILQQATVQRIVDFGANQVFPKPNVFTALLFLERKAGTGTRAAGTTQFGKVVDLDSFPQQMSWDVLDQNALESQRWTPSSPIVMRLLQTRPQLGEFAWVKDVGLNYWTEGRGKTRGGSIADRVLYDGRRKDRTDRPYLKGRDVDRYLISFGNHWLRHDYEKRLNPRVDTFRFSPEFLEREKIVYRQTSDRIIASLDPKKLLTDKTLHVIVLRDDWDGRIDLRYVLALLNSRLLNYLYRALSQEEGRTFAQVKIFRVKQLPIRLPDVSDPTAKLRHDRVVRLVDQMFDAKKQLAAARSDKDKNYYENKCAALDRQIDAMVYEFYELSEEEIRVVESSEN